MKNYLQLSARESRMTAKLDMAIRIFVHAVCEHATVRVTSGSRAIMELFINFYYYSLYISLCMTCLPLSLGENNIILRSSNEYSS